MSQTNNVSEREDVGDGVSLPPDFSQMLDKVLSNPQILTTVASALSQMSDKDTQKAEPTAEVAAVKSEGQTQDKAASPDVEAMMQKLPQIMSLLSSGARGSAFSAASDKRSCLLSAIKPYLNPARCEAIDYIIKFSQISEILKHIN